ncbi:MAG: HAD hydrolase family protein, partial [Candidatus Aenigmarchaeota archaeon]|nr:HAD hydrolase family protein [Candidatus Aenigmarchaeota archaeon]
DERRKGEIIDELMREYGLAREQVVAVGDGANDRQMLQNAGLGIAFNAKDALKKVSSGSISKENLVGILDVLGIKD